MTGTQPIGCIFSLLFNYRELLYRLQLQVKSLEHFTRLSTKYYSFQPGAQKTLVQNTSPSLRYRHSIGCRYPDASVSVAQLYVDWIIVPAVY